MKQLITLLLVCVSYLSLAAAEGTIELNKSELDREARSITNTISATYDDTVLRIYSDVPLENLQVAITDLFTGEVLYHNNIAVSHSQPFIITLNNEEDGNYKIELSIGQQYYYGFFEVTR